MEPKDIFSQRANDLYIDSGLSLKKLDKETGVTSTQMSKYHRGQAEPSLTNLYRLADYYGVSIDWLCGRPNAAKTYNSEIANAAAALGLSEKATESIDTFGSSSFVDLVLSNALFWESLGAIRDISSIVTFDVPSFSGEVLGHKAKELPSALAIAALRHEATRNLDLLIDEIIKKYTPTPKEVK